MRNEAGLDIPSLLEYVATQGTVKEFPGSELISNEELLLLECDVLIPAAVGGVLTKENAPYIRAKTIVEAANNPTHPAADDIFKERGIPVLPDILANAGGVTVSYFEWVQNRQHFRWDLKRVREELDKRMLDSFHRTWDMATTKKVNLRLAAYLLGIGRVGHATALGGI
ncbi:MAG: glutamate dehydrogenase [Planctomycetaceae bacterium]